MGIIFISSTILVVKKSLYSREQAVLQDLLRRLRLAAGLRQDEVAARLGTYQTFVSKYEAGERILDLPELRQVCGALGTTLVDFVKLYEEALQVQEWPEPFRKDRKQALE